MEKLTPLPVFYVYIFFFFSPGKVQADRGNLALQSVQRGLLRPLPQRQQLARVYVPRLWLRLRPGQNDGGGDGGGRRQEDRVQ